MDDSAEITPPTSLEYVLRCILSIISVVIVAGGLTLLAGTPSRNLVEYDPNLNPRFPMLLKQTKPEIVFLGNSMLGEGVDERLFMHQTGHRTFKLWSGGWSSAIWYLALKNVIVPASPRPKTVVIFFRDHFLTHPTYLVKGRYKKWIDQMTGPEEPVLERLAFLNAMNPLTYQLNQNWSLFQKRGDIKNTFEASVKSWIGSVYGYQDQKIVNQNIEQIFNAENLLADQLGKAQFKSEKVSKPRLYDFEKSLPISFLPEMIQITRDNDIQLILVRIKKRREVEGLPTPSGLDDYIHHLKQWCSKEQVPMIDFSEDTRLELKHYGSGDHLNRGIGRMLFTQLLAEELEPYLSSAAPR